MKKIGDLGELLVCRWLELENYRILERNWRCRWGEIDAIAQDRTTQLIAFVEVKTRGDRNWDENGLLAVDSRKQQKILQTASLFLAKFPHLAELPCRFDLGLVSYQSHPLKHSSTVKIAEIKRIDIGQAVALQEYYLTIEKYLQAAYD